MGKKLEKLIFKDKSKKRPNWQEECVFKAAKKIGELIDYNIRKDEEYFSVFAAPSSRVPSTVKERLSRNIASVFAESVDSCKVAGEADFKGWLKGDKKKDIGYKMPHFFGGLDRYVSVTRGKGAKSLNYIPLQDVIKSLETNKNFIKNLDFNENIIDVQTIKNDWLNNQRNDLKKAKFWKKNRVLGPKQADIIREL